PALTHDMDAGRRPRVELIDPELDEFRHAQPRSERKMKHRPIAYTRRRTRIWSIQQCLDLGPGQGGDQPLIDLLHRYRMHSQSLIEASRQAIFKEVEERLDGCQAGVS